MDVKFGQSEDTLSAACLKNCRIQYQTGLRYDPLPKYKYCHYMSGLWDCGGTESTPEDDGTKTAKLLCVSEMYRLHKDIIFPIEQVRSGVLVKRLHILPRWCSKPVLWHAAARLPFADLEKKWTASLYNERLLWENQPYTRRWSILRTTPPQNNTSRGRPVLTPRAGRWPAKTSWPRWAPWIRWRWTSSLADGSVQKWSEVFSFVYSRAHGPTKKTAHTYTVFKQTFDVAHFCICDGKPAAYLRHAPVCTYSNSWLNFDQITLLERILHC